MKYLRDHYVYSLINISFEQPLCLKSPVIKNRNLYFLALLFQLLDGRCTPANHPFFEDILFDQENCKTTALIHIKESILRLIMVI